MRKLSMFKKCWVALKEFLTWFVSKTLTVFKLFGLTRGQHERAHDLQAYISLLRINQTLRIVNNYLVIGSSMLLPYIHENCPISSTSKQYSSFSIWNWNKTSPKKDSKFINLLWSNWSRLHSVWRKFNWKRSFYSSWIVYLVICLLRDTLWWMVGCFLVHVPDSDLLYTDSMPATYVPRLFASSHDCPQ